MNPLPPNILGYIMFQMFVPCLWDMLRDIISKLTVEVLIQRSLRNFVIPFIMCIMFIMFIVYSSDMMPLSLRILGYPLFQIFVQFLYDTLRDIISNNILEAIKRSFVIAFITRTVTSVIAFIGRGKKKTELYGIYMV